MVFPTKRLGNSLSKRVILFVKGFGGEVAQGVVPLAHKIKVIGS